MKILAALCITIVFGWTIITTDVPRSPQSRPCTQEWFSYLDQHYFDVSDGEGHGPDLGTNEWFNSFEKRAQLQSRSRSSQAERCESVQNQLERRTYVINRQLGLTFSF